jgi:ABC-type glutathione transport system ATPase component
VTMTRNEGIDMASQVRVADEARTREIITFDGVGKSFFQNGTELVATKDIDVRIREGEIVTIVGPSGVARPPCSISWRV